MGALAFHENGHGISFEEYANHYLLVFDLTSTHQASHDYLHPELTSASISISCGSIRPWHKLQKYFYWEKPLQQFTSITAEKSQRTTI